MLTIGMLRIHFTGKITSANMHLSVSLKYLKKIRYKIVMQE